MALITETGAGLADAESYVSAAECSAYFAGQGNEAWSEVENKEAALRKATQYIDAQYRFKGERYSIGQALAFPRYGVVVDGYELSPSVLPRKLKEACYELAIRAATASLLSDVASQHVEEVSVGPISRKMSGLANGGQQRFAIVDSLLSELVMGGSGSATIRIVRA